MDRMQHLRDICRTRSIALAYLFGSQKDTALKILNGDDVRIQDPLADIDVGVVFDKPLPTVNRHELYAEVYADLADLFTPYQLDLVLLEENHSVFQAEALKGICVYCANDATRDRYENAILRRAADFRPFLEKYYEELLAEV